MPELQDLITDLKKELSCCCGTLCNRQKLMRILEDLEEHLASEE